LTPSLLLTTDSDHRLCQKKVPHILRVSTPCSVDSKSVKFQSLATCPMIRRFRSDLDSTTQIISRFAYRDFGVLVVMFLASPSRDSRNSDMESDQRSRSQLDLMAAIKSQFHISRFWWLCFLPLQVTIGEAPRWSSDQWSTFLVIRRSCSFCNLTSRCSLDGGSHHSKS
jgi:hypothetical protein